MIRDMKMNLHCPYAVIAMMLVSFAHVYGCVSTGTTVVVVLDAVGSCVGARGMYSFLGRTAQTVCVVCSVTDRHLS